MNPKAPLSKLQKAAVCAEARKAWEATGMSHIVKDASEWRQHEQEQAVGKSSLRECTQLDYKRLLAHFRGLTGESRTHLYVSGDARQFAGDRLAQARKVQAILCDNGLSWTYADGICQQMFETARIEWCKSKELTAVITALIKRYR